MKKKLIVAGIVLGFIITAVISFQFGYYHCFYTTHDIKCGEIKAGIEMRTEAYSPSCAELKNNGLPKIKKINDDYFLVHSSQSYFYVFGINIEPSKPPQIHWWGASNEEVLKNCNDK